jgi:predicted DNA-binding transcriptional regulator AlpA
MPRKNKVDSPAAELDPWQIVRFRDGKKWFGYGPTQLEEKIKSGEVPKPMRLSDSGRALGWLGKQIIEHHRKLEAKNKSDA